MPACRAGEFGTVWMKIQARRSYVAFAATAALAVAAYAAAMLGFGSFAQDGGPVDGARAETGRKAPSRPVQKPPPAPTRKPETPPAAATAPPQAAATPITAKLKQAGAGTCSAEVERLAAGAMGAVAQFNTVSSWATTGADKRAVSVSIGQSYGPDKPVPFGATSIFAAPNWQGGCDGMAVQVVPSPLPCAKLRESLAAGNGRQIGDLAGVPVMQDGSGQTLLVPGAANTCVLIGLRTAYAN